MNEKSKCFVGMKVIQLVPMIIQPSKSHNHKTSNEIKFCRMEPFRYERIQ